MAFSYITSYKRSKIINHPADKDAASSAYEIAVTTLRTNPTWPPLSPTISLSTSHKLRFSLSQDRGILFKTMPI